MTSNAFRRIALGMDGVVEGAHMGHADFRVGGRIFASLGYPDAEWGMVALSLEQQADLLRDHKALSAARGAWGQQGATMVHLPGVDEETLGGALTMAFQNALTRPSKTPRSRSPKRTPSRS